MQGRGHRGGLHGGSGRPGSHGGSGDSGGHGGSGDSGEAMAGQGTWETLADVPPPKKTNKHFIGES